MSSQRSQKGRVPRATRASGGRAARPDTGETSDDGDEPQDSDEPQDDAFDAELVADGEAAELSEARVVTARSSATSRATPLARYDPLQAYMRDVQRYKLLTPAEERDAAIRYYEHGDLEAAAKLVTANLRLVVKIAYEYRRAHRHIPDLIQEGSIGLMQAVRKYDPYRGVKLSTYAAWWIRAYILRFVLNNARLVKLGTTQAQRKLFFNLRKERARLSAMGIEPTAELIAKRLDVAEAEVVSMERRLAANDMSLDAPVHSSEPTSTTRLDMLSGSAREIDDALADRELSELLSTKVHAFGRTLAGKDARIFTARMLAEDPLTLQQLGEEFGVSRERVRQLEARIQLRLKEYIAKDIDPEAIKL